MFGPRHEYRLGIILDEVGKLPAGARILDGAVGLGQLARQMQRRGYLAIGIDYALEAALYATRAGTPSVVRDGGTCIATVPALQSLWSRSDDYYEHRRRYTRAQLTALFDGFDIVKAKFWGFPIVLVYDTIFILPMNMRRARREVAGDAALQSVARAGRARWLVNVVRAVFSIDRLFGWIPFGPGLLLVARKR